MVSEQILRKKYSKLSRSLNEKSLRLTAAADAANLGRGGVSIVARSSGISRTRIYRGLRDLQKKYFRTDRVRRFGAGRKTIKSKQPNLLKCLESLVAPATVGNPMSHLKYTTKSLRQLQQALKENGYDVGRSTIADILKDDDYSLQANKKDLNGSSHKDRNAQFKYIDKQVGAFLKGGYPVISVDTKKKELVGNFKNPGKVWRKKGNPERVLDHDFPDKELGKAVPYGVYDLKNNSGWVSVGVDGDTAAFAVESIRSWWSVLGKAEYKNNSKLLICADAGGSNGYRVRLWKTELEKFAKNENLSITVCHFPPGTSKWNKIEHRLFSFISMNWKGQPLISHEVVLNLIGTTTTRSGLKVKTQLDPNKYPTGTKISDKEFAEVKINRHEFHGEWNYTIN